MIPSIALVISRCFYTPVSYTHLDVYKRQEQILESVSSSCEKKIDEMNKNFERKFNQILNKKLDDKVIVCLLYTSTGLS